MSQANNPDRLFEHREAEKLADRMAEALQNGEIDDLVYVYENCDELKRLVDVTGREMLGARERMREERGEGGY